MAKTTFREYNKNDLLEICNEFGVEVNKNATKEELLANLAEDGVEHSLYLSMHPELAPDYVEPEVPAVEDVKVETSEKILLKMTRPNRTYEVRGVRFTQRNPYALVSEEDAEFLINKVGGFQPAMPREVEAYYA